MKKYLATLLIVLTAISANAEIAEMKNIKNLQEKIEELKQDHDPKNILVIFSMKDTLVMPEDSELLLRNTDINDLKNLFTKIFANIKIGRGTYLNDIIFINHKHKLIDSAVTKVIANLQNLKVPTIIINEGMIGKFDKIPRIEVYKANYFKKLGIDLEHSFAENDFVIQKVDNNKSTKVNDKKPGKINKDEIENYYHGIITYNKSPIMSIIINFLNQVKFIPTTIIMIDYDQNNLSGIETQLASFNNGIKFFGYHYTAFDNVILPPPAPLQKILDVWYDIVKKTNEVKR